MQTTSVYIKPYLAEYCIAKYGTHYTGTVDFPAYHKLNWIVYNLTANRPVTKNTNTRTNIQIVLHQKKRQIDGIFKNINYYNHIPAKNHIIIQRHIQNEFWTEAYEYLVLNKRKGIYIKESAELFLHKYNIKSLTSEAITKHYTRYKNRITKNNQEKTNIFN